MDALEEKMDGRPEEDVEKGGRPGSGRTPKKSAKLSQTKSTGGFFSSASIPWEKEGRSEEMPVPSIKRRGSLSNFSSLVPDDMTLRRMSSVLPADVKADQEHTRRNLWWAVGLVGFSAFVYSLQSLNAKILGSKDKIDFWTVTIFRGLVGTCLSSVGILMNRSDRTFLGKPQFRKKLALRGLLGAIQVTSAFYAFANMPLASASVIIFTSPLWTALFNRFFAAGRWTKYDTMACLFCIAGMLLVTQPKAIFGSRQSEHKKKEPKSVHEDRGIIAAFISSFALAGVNIMIRKLKGEATATVTLYAMVGSMLFCLPGFLYQMIRYHGAKLASASYMLFLQLCLTGLLSWTAQMCKTSGLQISRSVGVLVLRYLDIFFAWIWDIVVIGDPFDPFSASGSALIVVSCVGSAIVNNLTTKTP